MKEWVSGALHSLREKNEDDVVKAGNSRGEKKMVTCSSQEYLSCALKIAYSVADQLCTIHEQRGYDFEGRRGHDDNKSWSHYIYVHCGLALCSGDYFDSITPCENHSAPDDLQNNTDSRPVEFLNVKGATLMEDAIRSFPVDDGRMVIHKLGASFCELFSGGKIVFETDCTPQQPSNPAGGAGTLQSTQALSIPLLDYDDSDKNELKSAMELIEAIGDDDELFGNPNNVDSNNVDDCLEGISAIGIGTTDSGCDQSTRNRSNSYYKLRKMPRTPFESTSLEPLKSLCLPTTLCDLISSMIESTKNDDALCVNETYNTISEVRDDLKLMMNYPHLYLRDLDIAHATNVGLQFEAVGDRDGRIPLYGREFELEKLKGSYRRSILSGREVAMIIGQSGIGKSKLSEEFTYYLTAISKSRDDKGENILLSGRFHKPQESHPFQTLSSSFDEYCSWLSKGDSLTIEKVASALKEDLGEEVSSLVTVMPNLSRILGSNFGCDKDDENDDGAVDAQKRMRYLFCQFVEIIVRCHEMPLVLFFDDCQWIDSASAALLNEILMISGASIKNHRVFFFGCCRDDEVNETHPLAVMLASLCNFGTKVTRIQLTSMSKAAVNEMVSATLSLLPLLTRPLSDILHHKTKGSPFFVKQLMIELYKQRLLYPSLTRRRWVWEAESIRDMTIPESIAIFIMKSFHRLPSEVLSALRVLSCFGVSADVGLLQRLEDELHLSLIDQLDVAVTMSVIGKRNEEFYFLHDKLQEAAYTSMKSEERCLQHFRCGVALGDFATKEKNDKLLLIAVGQINQGGPQAVIDTEQGVAVARMNLHVGKVAMKMADFFSAYLFFDHGISYLRKGHWNTHYDLSLELYNLAARCAIMNADHVSVKILTDQITRRAKSFEDEYEAISITITLLTWSGKLFEAIKVINVALTSLGEELPATITQSLIEDHLNNTKKKLAGLQDETLLGYPTMVESSKIMAMELFVKLFESFTFAGFTTSFPIIPLKMIQTSLEHGMSPLSPLGFAIYGSYLTLVKGEVDEGYSYVKFALSLMKRMPSRAHDGKIIFHSSHTKLHVEPMQSAVESYIEANKAAMKSGNVTYALGCTYCYDYFCFWSGKKLDVVAESMKMTITQLEFHKNLNMLTLLQPVFRVIMRLMGKSDAPQQDLLTNVFGETCEERDIIGKLPSHLHTIYFLGFCEAFIFREFNKASEFATIFFSHEGLSKLTMSTPNFFRTL
jgi:predicted ATPase